MANYAVIAENDESQWEDDTGVLYHFPARYRRLLTVGTRAVYYKGRTLDQRFGSARLSKAPHYFGTATIGRVFTDRESKKGDLFASIDDFETFTVPVGIGSKNAYLEPIPPGREANYWRDGVRPITADIFAMIVGLAGSNVRVPFAPQADEELESGVEGNPTKRFVTTYERDPRNRRKAIAFHGTSCFACDADLGVTYGSRAQGFIHVHHVIPVSSMEAPRKIDPLRELVPICPNCHGVIHRQKASTLTIDQLRGLLGKPPRCADALLDVSAAG